MEAAMLTGQNGCCFNDKIATVEKLLILKKRQWLRQLFFSKG
jgi:hypothetical protein